MSLHHHDWGRRSCRYPTLIGACPLNSPRKMPYAPPGREGASWLGSTPIRVQAGTCPVDSHRSDKWCIPLYVGSMSYEFWHVSSLLFQQDPGIWGLWRFFLIAIGWHVLATKCGLQIKLGLPKCSVTDSKWSGSDSKWFGNDETEMQNEINQIIFWK